MKTDKARCLIASHWPPKIVARGELAFASRADLDLYQCPLCEGQAHIASIDERGYRVVKPCEGALMDRRIERYNQALIPGRYAKAALTTFEIHAPEHPAMIEALRRYMSAFAPGDMGRLLAGPVGTGKTHLLVAILSHLTLEKGIPCRFVEFSHLLSSLRKQYAEGKSDSEILDPLAKIEVLAIDELGKGRCNEFELRIIDELISRRYNSTGLTTLFATNYLPSSEIPKDSTFDSLANRIGERVESRIFEMAKTVVLQGEDYRRRLAQRSL